MLYSTLKKLKARGGMTADLARKVDVFFALGKLTEAEYKDLLDIDVEAKRKGEQNDSRTNPAPAVLPGL